MISDCYDPAMSERVGGKPPSGVAFLLTQVGTHAARRFAERVAELDITPPVAGLLRSIATGPGRSQQAVADELGLLPSRLVAFVDDLERRGLVERRRNADDRRQYALWLTADGQALLGRIGRTGREHELDLTRSLDDGERAQLGALLARIAEDQGLTPHVHPGFSSLK